MSAPPARRMLPHCCCQGSDACREHRHGLRGWAGGGAPARRRGPGEEEVAAQRRAAPMLCSQQAAPADGTWSHGSPLLALPNSSLLTILSPCPPSPPKRHNRPAHMVQRRRQGVRPQALVVALVSLGEHCQHGPAGQVCLCGGVRACRPFPSLQRPSTCSHTPHAALHSRQRRRPGPRKQGAPPPLPPLQVPPLPTRAATLPGRCWSACARLRPDRHVPPLRRAHPLWPASDCARLWATWASATERQLPRRWVPPSRLRVP